MLYIQYTFGGDFPMANEAIEKFNALMQEYVDKSYEELFEIASKSLEISMEVFNKIAKDGNGAPYVVLFISTTLAMDGKFTELEYKFLNELLGGNVNYENAKANVQSHYSDECWIISRSSHLYIPSDTVYIPVSGTPAIMKDTKM